jgi:PIN domain nuclease of toxin-antitoxin system
MVLIVLDTHIFLWLNLDPKRIPAGIITALDKESTWGIPAISLWEIAMLDSKGRIALPNPALSWLQDVLSPEGIELIPITPEIAVCSGSLAMHGDPADRLIAATAISHGCFLATVDDTLLDMPNLRTIKLK